MVASQNNITRIFSNNIPVNYQLFWYSELSELYPDYRLSGIQAVTFYSNSSVIHGNETLCSHVTQQILCVDETGIRSSVNFHIDELNNDFTFVINGMGTNVMDGTTRSLEIYLSFYFKEDCSIVTHLLMETLRRCNQILLDMQRINNPNKIEFHVPKSHGKIVIEDITIINKGGELFFWALTHGGQVLSNKQSVTSETLRLVIDVTNINIFDFIVRHSTSFESYVNEVTVKIRYYVLRDFCRQSFCYASSLNLQLAFKNNRCFSSIQATSILDRLKMCSGKFFLIPTC